MPMPRNAFKAAIRFLGRYVLRRFFSHLVVLAAVLMAVACNVASHYAVKHLVDVLAPHQPPAVLLWGAVGILLGLVGQATRYFVEQFPGALAGRITAAANAAWTIENSVTWTTIPPGTAGISSLLVLGTINWHRTVVPSCYASVSSPKSSSSSISISSGVSVSSSVSRTGASFSPACSSSRSSSSSSVVVAGRSLFIYTSS